MRKDVIQLHAHLPAPVKTALRPFYHCVFRAQLRARCLLDDFIRRKHNRAHGIPPAMIRFRVGESIDSDDFLTVGKGCASIVKEHLDELGVALKPGVRVLDFGCGCGRVMRWLMKTEPPPADFYGADVDRAAIDWCTKNLKGARFEVTSPRPPLPYADEFFDAIYCVSVFTHLDETMQDLWLEELRRILKPGGTLIFTVHGPVAARILETDERDRLRSNGFLHLRSRKLKGIVPGWYNVSWHTIDYTVQRASKWFSWVEYRVIPDSAQDVVLCRA